MSVLIGPGTAYASGIDILPGSGRFLPSTVAELAANSTAWAATVADVAPVAEGVGAGAVAVATLPVDAVVAGILGTGATMYAAWRFGSYVGAALPCFDCPSGPVAGSPTMYASGVSVLWPTNIPGGPNSVFHVEVTIPAGVTYNALTTAFGNATDHAIAYDSRPVTGPRRLVFDMQTRCIGCYGAAVTSGTVYDYDQGRLAATGSPDIAEPQANTANGSAVVPASGAATGEPLVHDDTSVCRPSAGGATSEVTTTSGPFVASSSALPPMAFPACPGGTRVGARVTVRPATAGSALPAHVVLATGTLGTATPAGHPEYADCMPGGAAYPCALALRRVLSDGTKRAYDPAVDYAAANDPANRANAFECTWGLVAVAVTECAPIYQSPPRPAPGPVGSPGTSNCNGAGVGLNPVSWVVVPLKCLWEPSPGALQSAYDDGRAGFDATGLPVWGQALGGVAGSLGGLGGAGSSGCAGPHFSFTLAHHVYAFDPLDACSEPMRSVALVVKLFASLAVIVGGARLCARPLLTAFGMRGVV